MESYADQPRLLSFVLFRLPGIVTALYPTLHSTFSVRTQSIERFVQLAADVLGLFCAWQLSAAMESRVLPYLGFTRWSSAFSSAPPLWHVVIAWLLLTFWAGIYRSAYPPDRWSRLVGAAHAAIAVTCAIVIASFLSAEAVRRSRSIVLTITPLSFVLFSLSRLASRSLAHHLLDVSNSRRGVAVLGCSDDAIAILEYLQTSNPDVRGLIVPKGYEMSAAASGAPILGTTTELAEVINREKLDRIVMLNGSL